LCLADDRGLRNLVHADRQPIIELHAKRFSQHYTDVVQRAKAKVFTLVDEYLDKAFRNGVAQIAMPVAKYLRGEMKMKTQLVGEEADRSICTMAEYNTAPDLIFTPNSHYLNGLIKQMVEKDSEMASDNGGARHIYHNIRAFIKVQVKLISELASKVLTHATLVQLDRHFQELMASSLSKHDRMLKKTEKIARERESLRKRKNVLEAALKEMTKM
jgi:hypothetical protein